MKTLITLFFLILTISVSAQNKQVTTMSNGSIEEIGYLTSDGKKDSVWTRYNDNGVIIALAHFNKGVKDGLWETYNDKGVKLFEILYVGGCKKYGKRWDDNGVLIEEKDF